MYVDRNSVKSLFLGILKKKIQKKRIKITNAVTIRMMRENTSFYFISKRHYITRKDYKVKRKARNLRITIIIKKITKNIYTPRSSLLLPALTLEQNIACTPFARLYFSFIKFHRLEKLLRYIFVRHNLAVSRFKLHPTFIVPEDKTLNYFMLHYCLLSFLIVGKIYNSYECKKCIPLSN